jgi:hypothetical protein
VRRSLSRRAYRHYRGFAGRKKTEWLGEVDRLFPMLDDARERSPLPEDAPNRDELEGWLVELRCRRA